MEPLKKVNLRLPATLWAKMKARAIAHGQKLEFVAAQAFRDFLAGGK